MALPYPLNRMFDALIPLIFLIVGTVFGTYTFLHLLLIERQPSLVFDFSQWRDQSFTRLWTAFGPIAAKGDIGTVPHVVGVAQGVVVDLGYVQKFRII
jgi:hypothetical protein